MEDPVAPAKNVGKARPQRRRFVRATDEQRAIVYLIWRRGAKRRFAELRWFDRGLHVWIYRSACTSNAELAEKRRQALEERLRANPRAGDGRSRELWINGPHARIPTSENREWYGRRKSEALGITVVPRKRCNGFLVRWFDLRTNELNGRDVPNATRSEAWEVALQMEAELLNNPDSYAAPCHITDELARQCWESEGVERYFPTVEEMDPQLVERLDAIVAKRTEEIRAGWSEQDHRERWVGPEAVAVPWTVPGTDELATPLARRGREHAFAESVNDL